jgi:hypothetical protein
MIFGAFILLSVAANVVGASAVAVMGNFAWVGGSVAWIIYAFQYNAKTWPTLSGQWENTFLCHRCSHVFVAKPSGQAL